MVSALSGSITRVRAEEFSDIRTYGAPDVVRDWMLFGKTPEEVAHERHGRRARARASASRCAWSPTSWASTLDPQLRTTHEMAVATAPIDSPIGPIAAGHGGGPALPLGGPGRRRAGDHRRGELADGGGAPRPALGLRARRRALRGGDHRRSELPGHASSKLHPESIEAGLERNPGVVATAMHCVNAVPYVCAAEPGLRTYLEMPLVAGRAAPSLQPGRTPLRDPRPLPPRRPGRHRHRRRARDRPRHRRRPRRGGRRRGAGGADARPTSTRWPGWSSGPDGGRSSCPPTSPSSAELERLVDAAVDGVRPARHPVNNAGGAMPRAAHGHERGLPRVGLSLQRDRAVHPDQAGGPADGRHGRIGARWSTSRRARPA